MSADQPSPSGPCAPDHGRTPAPTSAPEQTSGPGQGRGRLATACGGVLGGLTGLAPHVLHHIGPLVGTAVVAGSGGTVLFGLLGLLLSVPMLRRLYRRFGTWRAPALAVGAFAVVFLFSSFVVGPWISGAGPATPPAPVDHQGHHG